MPNRWQRIETWVGLAVAGAGALAAVIVGLYTYVTFTATPLHPEPNRATPYFPRFGADPRYGLHLMRPIDYSCYAGVSAFLSTPSDLVRFGLAANRGTLLQPATVETLQAPQRISSGEETGYGLGSYADTQSLTLSVAEAFAARPAVQRAHEVMGL